MFTIKTSLNISVHTVAIFLSFLFTSACCMCPPLYDTLFHIAVIVIFLCLGLDLFSLSFFFFFLSYLQFYPSRKALVIKTHAFTIIINLDSFFTNPNINWQQRDKVIQWANTFFSLFLFFSCLFFFLTSLVAIFFLFHFPLAFFFFSFLPAFFFFLELSCFFSFFSFLFLGALCRQLFLLFFFSSFWGHRIFFFLFSVLSFFPCFIFSGGLVFSLSPSIAWTSHLK